MPSRILFALTSSFFKSVARSLRSHTVELAFSKDCDFSMACHVATFSGERNTGLVSDANVRIAKFGVPAHLRNAHCTVFCDEATLTFIYHGVRYVIGKKGGNLKGLLRWANALVPAAQLVTRS